MTHDPTARPERVTSAARVAAFFLLDQAVSIGEVRLFAMVDGAACLLNHGGHVESARLLLEVAAPELAGRTVRILLGEEG